MRTPKQKTSAQKRYEQLKSRGLCYTLSLHDALPIFACGKVPAQPGKTKCIQCGINASKSALSWYYRKHKEVQHGTE